MWDNDEVQTVTNMGEKHVGPLGMRSLGHELENPATVVNQIMDSFSRARSLEVRRCLRWLRKLITSELMSSQIFRVAGWPLRLQPLHQG